MIKLLRLCSLQCHSRRKLSSLIDVSREVRDALNSKRPVIALETALVTHGLPYPENLNTALSAEEAIHAQGAVPATIGVVKGRVKVGFSKDTLLYLAEDSSSSMKVSRRDFPYVISKGVNGGTTVSGTMVVADLVGIRIFATGGLGGVHRGGEQSMDVSADLTELGRTPIAVVSSGVKAILDIERTLEYLETQGVCVAALGPQGMKFPAFYSCSSSVPAPLNLESIGEAADLVAAMCNLGLRSGILLAVPVPEDHALDGLEVEQAVERAMQKAETAGVYGKQVTPFLLQEVSAYTGGRAIVANQSLIINNAQTAAKLAVEVQKRLTN